MTELERAATCEEGKRLAEKVRRAERPDFWLAAARERVQNEAAFISSYDDAMEGLNAKERQALSTCLRGYGNQFGPTAIKRLTCYSDIKALALAQGCRVADLIALAPGNDPFYCGAPAHRKQAEWFASMWEMLKPPPGTHIRRLHYQLISQRDTILGADGLPYVNTDKCWGQIGVASKYARYLELVPANAFSDRRNPEAQIFTQFFVDASVKATEGLAPWLPSFIEPPSLELTPPTAMQRYHLEVWCEKSTINDVLIPLCEWFRAVLVTGVGEMSVTRLRQLVQRGASGGRPVRVFYISDFDPAGQSMPVAAARKAEYFIRKEDQTIDLKLFPVALTIEQCHEFKLPRTPIKESEVRRGGFEARHGEGATELDAIEALHPGALRRILAGELGRYYDDDLDRRVMDAAGCHHADLLDITARVHDAHRDKIASLKQEHRQFREQIAEYGQRCLALWGEISDELEMNVPESFDWPEANLADEERDALFDSARTYEDQLAAYKRFQGRGTISAGDTA